MYIVVFLDGLDLVGLALGIDDHDVQQVALRMDALDVPEGVSGNRRGHADGGDRGDTEQESSDARFPIHDDPSPPIICRGRQELGVQYRPATFIAQRCSEWYVKPGVTYITAQVP